MSLSRNSKTIVQCDFDGTVTVEDVSFMLLNRFAEGNWREILEEYRQRRITVGRFNSKAFALVRADRQTLLQAILEDARVRPGFMELAKFCRQKDYRLVIVSNGLDFYIQFTLENLGLNHIEICAAETRLYAGRVQVQYVGPDGSVVDDDFKAMHTRLYLSQGYNVIYIGNGTSDLEPARLSHLIFAREDLLSCCQRDQLKYHPFEDFNDILKELAQDSGF